MSWRRLVEFLLVIAVGIPVIVLVLLLAFVVAPEVFPAWAWKAAFFVVALAYYAYFLVSKPGYSRDEVKATDIPGFTSDERGILLESRRCFSAWIILRALSKHPHSRRGLAELVQKSGIITGSEAVRIICKELRDKGLVASVVHSHPQKIKLTERGRFCIDKINHHFPKTNFWFLFRRGIGGTDKAK